MVVVEEVIIWVEKAILEVVTLVEVRKEIGLKVVAFCVV